MDFESTLYARETRGQHRASECRLAHVALLQRTARDQAQQPCQMVLDKVCSALHRHAVCIAPLGIVRNAQNPNIVDICLVGKLHIFHSR